MLACLPRRPPWLLHYAWWRRRLRPQLAQSSRRSPWEAPRLGVSSDGTHVWVANDNSDTVTELDAATGAVVQTIAVGSEPYGVSSDGTHVWVTNGGSDTVTELDAATGTIVQTITVANARQRVLRWHPRLGRELTATP